MASRRVHVVGGGGASVTMDPWEHPFVWEFVGRGRYLQAAFCKSAAQLYSAKFGISTLKSLSNIAAEKGFINFLAWSKEIGCCWDESVFRSGAAGGNVNLLKFLRHNDCPMPRDAELCTVAGVEGHLEALKFLRQVCGCVWDDSFCEVVANDGRLKILQYAYAQQPRPGWDSYKVCFAAARRGHIHILKWAHKSLHEDGLLFDGGTCEAAASSGRLASLQCLRGLGCKWDGRTCRAAMEIGDLGVLKWASDNGCPFVVNELLLSHGQTGLHNAEEVDMIEFLISRGANINAVDDDGETPLHWAVRDGLLDAVKTLLKAGADVNITDVIGRTPLSMACDEEHHEIAEVLREAGGR